MRYHSHPLEGLKFKKHLTIASFSDDVEKLGLSYTDGGNIENGAAIFENNLAVFDKVKHTSTIRPSHSTPLYLPREMKADLHTKTCLTMFIAALFMRPKRSIAYNSKRLGEMPINTGQVK